jgi:hypothetical protein
MNISFAGPSKKKKWGKLFCFLFSKIFLKVQSNNIGSKVDLHIGEPAGAKFG